MKPQRVEGEGLSLTIYAGSEPPYEVEAGFAIVMRPNGSVHLVGAIAPDQLVEFLREVADNYERQSRAELS